MDCPADIPKINAMAAIMPIHFASQKFVTKRNIGKGLDQALGKVAGSRDFVLSFRDCYPSVWNELIEKLRVDDDELVAALESDGNTSEPIVEKDITEKQRRTMRIGLILSLNAMKSPWSKPVQETYRELNKEGYDNKSLIHETRWLEVLLAKECEAKSVLCKFARSDELLNIIGSLSPSSDMPASFSKIQETVADGTAAAGFPGTAKEITKNAGPSREPKPTLYEIVTWKADEELNLTPAQAEFDASIERWVETARAEAATWNAPRILFDHLFLRLLRFDTDTAEYLASKGVEREAWISEIEGSLSKQEDLGRPPRLSEEIGDSIPEDTVKIDILEAMRAVKDAGLSSDEEFRLHWDLYERSAIERSFTDLMWLEQEPFKHSSRGWQLLHSMGISEDTIKQEIQRRQGYPDPVMPPFE